MLYIDEESQNPITVVAIKKGNTYSIGVARCGNMDQYSKDLGIEIATRRAQVQPWAEIKDLTKGAFFNYIVPTIVSNQRRMKQSNLQNFRRL